MNKGAWRATVHGAAESQTQLKNNNWRSRDERTQFLEEQAGGLSRLHCQRRLAVWRLGSPSPIQGGQAYLS